MGFDDLFFQQTADDLIDHLLSIPSPMREGIDQKAFAAGKAVEIPLPPDARIQLQNTFRKD